MICSPCQAQKHEECPALRYDDPSKPPTGLSPEGNAVQKSGLCTCRHRVRLVEAYTTDALNKLVVIE